MIDLTASRRQSRNRKSALSRSGALSGKGVEKETAMRRRDFLEALHTVAWIAIPSLARASEIVDSGAIGPVRFGRVGCPRWVAVARRLCGNSALIVEVDAATSGAVLLGSAATLVIDRKGCRLLP